MQTAITRTSGPGRVLLADDHPAVRRVLRSLLEEVGGWQVVDDWRLTEPDRRAS